MPFDWRIAAAALFAASTPLAWAAGARAAQAPKFDPDNPPPPDEGPVHVVPMNDGQYAWRYLYHPDRTDQKIGLWVPDGLKVVRGLFLHLHRESEAHRRDFQEFARAMDFGVYCMLIRWANYEKILPDQLDKLGRELGHPEVVNVPWAAMGGSRNVGALTAYMMADPNPHRILCLLYNGGPGVGMKLDDPDQLARFAQTPVMTVNGSADPFVGGLDWAKGLYPKIRNARLPWGCATEWDGGHGLHDGNVMYWPFVKAACDARLPEDADSTKGVVPLRPVRYEDGFLVGPVNWDDPGKEPAAPVPEFQGDPAKAVWLPDRHTLAVWRAFMVNEPPARLVAESLEAGRVRLALRRDECARLEKAEFFAGDDKLGEATGPSPTLETGALARGVHSVFAVLTGADGKPRHTRPIVVAAGRFVDQHAGMMDAFQADRPLAVIQLDDHAKDALRALDARKTADAPRNWKLVFHDDFTDGLHPAWYEYYARSRERSGGHGEYANVLQAVDGEMDLVANPHQAVAMLPWDWPDDVAVHYRAKALDDRHCDLSLVLSGNPFGSAFPWREGMMFQFGAHFNQGSFFLVREQPDKNWKEFDCGARIEPRTWHDVRIERRDGVCKAFIDGRLVATCRLAPTDLESFFGRKIGLYTFGSTARFDDVKVYVLAPDDPDALQPPAPGDDALLDAARGLVRVLGHRHAEQAGAARRLITDFSFELAPALKRLREAGEIADQRAAERVDQLLEAVRPD